MRNLPLLLIIMICVVGCAPKEPVVLRQVQLLSLTTGNDGKPVLKANAILFNPNKGSLRLKEIDLNILLNGQPAANIDQKLNALIKGNAEFSIPLEVRLQLKETGLLDTFLSMFGGKKYEIQFVGKLKITVGGFPVRIPIDHKDQLKL
ncbi:MAG: LEA type 2 family protein [Cyclobacteriaceae bacterium]|nr:LEA type 2 family protein [Cyclobacteriaceae bacterium]